jgi:hypothetical protein
MPKSGVSETEIETSARPLQDAILVGRLEGTPIARFAIQKAIFLCVGFNGLEDLCIGSCRV